MSTGNRGPVLVLLAGGFEEKDVVTVTRTLRRAGLPVKLVGLTAGLVRGAYGLSLLPDATLSEVDAEQPQAIVVPGGLHSSHHLRADPRVHALLGRVVTQGSYVVALASADSVLHQAGVWPERPEPATEGQHRDLSMIDQVRIEGPIMYGPQSGLAQEIARTLASLLQGQT
jgi:putative intracellular protease/amidase